MSVVGRKAFSLLALVPAAAFVWTLAQTSTVTSGEAVTEVMPWIPGLNIELAMRMGTLQWAVSLLVTGVGALVLGYCGSYFDKDEPGLAAFAGILTGFAGTMLGLVLSDDMLVMYVFWELTTICSYLLVGHDPTSRKSRAAAMQALLVTTLGGLAMLVGFLIIGLQADTYRFSEVVADPPSGTLTTAAVALILLGAITKSAMVPFHFWLPGAMAAPTPVSAYLHAAAMVKAGVYLVALLAPAFAQVPGWRVLTMGLGVATMILGGWRALRQTDLKLLIAYGTVSQLGFLIVVVGTGTRSAALAGLAMVLAHGLFKATLFLVVGIIDHSAGTRDLKRLSGVGRAHPVLTVIATLAAASMAGIPPMAGFVAKESVFVALHDVATTGDGTSVGLGAGWLTLAGVVAGSVLTVAYSARFVWGAFAHKRGCEPYQPHRLSPWFVTSPALLSVSGLVLGFVGPVETEALMGYAEVFPPGEHEPSLALWHGVELELGLSIISLAGGLLLFWQRDRVWRFQRRVSPAPDAEAAYRIIMRGLDRLAVEITGATQRGSLGVYLSVILVVFAALPGAAAAFRAFNPDQWNLVWWDFPAQALVAVVVIVAALGAARARRRLKAIVLAGITGYGTAMIFLLHGAPDLALTQILVETVVVVIFVLVLRRLPVYFSDRPFTLTRYWRLLIAGLTGLVVAGIALVAVSARTADPISTTFPEAAYEGGGGDNVVNVTLVDIRAWDTMGEIAVLVVAATGVASMVFISTRRYRVGRASDAQRRARIEAKTTQREAAERRRPPRVWLAAGSTLSPERRSIIFEVVTRIAFPMTMMFSVYLLFAGHNNPGGGFAGGLFAGLALMVRYLAGGRYELNEAAPIDAGAVMGSGLVLAIGYGLSSLLFGGQVLESLVFDLHIPVLGEVHLVTSLAFDLGVYLVVVGLMLDVLRSLGGGVDRQLEESPDTDDGPALSADEQAPATETRTGAR